MDSLVSLKKLEQIYELLLSMVSGKVLHEISLNESLEPLDLILNQLEQIEKQLAQYNLQHGYTVPVFSLFKSSRFVFVLNHQMQIQFFNQDVLNQLHYPDSHLEQLFFQNIIECSTQPILLEKFQKALNNTPVKEVFKLNFITSDGCLFPVHCTLDYINQMSFVVLVSWDFNFDMDVYLPKRFGESNSVASKEVVAVQKLHQYIMTHLDEPLPTLPQLAKLFGVGIHQLKTQFKVQYQTSIYHFYQEKRLQKAFELIQGTQLNFKEIAYQCGFDLYINFYKAFKKKFGFSPSQLKRR